MFFLISFSCVMDSHLDLQTTVSHVLPGSQPTSNQALVHRCKPLYDPDQAITFIVQNHQSPEIDGRALLLVLPARNAPLQPFKAPRVLK